MFDFLLRLIFILFQVQERPSFQEESCDGHHSRSESEWVGALINSTSVRVSKWMSEVELVWEWVIVWLIDCVSESVSEAMRESLSW